MCFSVDVFFLLHQGSSIVENSPLKEMMLTQCSIYTVYIYIFCTTRFYNFPTRFYNFPARSYNFSIRFYNFPTRSYIYIVFSHGVLWTSGVLAGGPWPPVKIFRGCQKLEQGVKNCITNDSRMPFVGRNSEFGKTEELLNSVLGVFASWKGKWPRWQERFNCLSLPVRLHLVWL